MSISAKRKEFLTVRLLYVLSQHVGRGNAIDQGELYQLVFKKPCTNKHNQARELRALIEDLRKKGIPILSTHERDGGGYYLAQARQEIEDYCKRLRKRALKLLDMEAQIKGKTLPGIVAEIAFSLGSHKLIGEVERYENERKS
jgi:hypothetical protein